MTNNKPVLTDFIGTLDISKQTISEAKKDNPQELYIQGIIQKAEEQNKNGRVYPKPILEREIDKFGQKIDQGNNGGELDHPDSAVVNLKNISHTISEIWWDGNNVMGKIKILNTPSGKIAQELIANGVKLGISSRGLGSTISQEGVQKVQENYELLTWDLVSDPSTKGAYLNRIQEGYSGKLNEKYQVFNNINNLITDILSIDK